LALVFGFGTVHWWLSVNGQVWFTAQITATTFLLLSLLEIFGKKRPAWAAFWLGMAALARPPALLALPALAWLLHEDRSWRKIAQGVIPLAAIGILMGFYNFARYGNPLELGYRYMQLEQLLARRVAETGSFNFVYLSDNLYNAFIKLPQWQTRWPYAVMDGWGMSMIVSTPVLGFIFSAPWRQKAVQAMGAAAILVALPSLFYYNTGYLQAGYRYALDFLPFLLVIVAISWRGRLRWHSVLLAALSVLMGLLSVVNFIQLTQ
jgi:Gpi18-like mannosyltransferase